MSWVTAALHAQVVQSAIINNPGSAGGPSVPSLVLAGYTNPPPQLTWSTSPTRVST